MEEKLKRVELIIAFILTEDTKNPENIIKELIKVNKKIKRINREFWRVSEILFMFFGLLGRTVK